MVRLVRPQAADLGRAEGAALLPGFFNSRAAANRPRLLQTQQTRSSSAVPTHDPFTFTKLLWDFHKSRFIKIGVQIKYLLIISQRNYIY